MKENNILEMQAGCSNVAVIGNSVISIEGLYDKPTKTLNFFVRYNLNHDSEYLSYIYTFKNDICVLSLSSKCFMIKIAPEVYYKTRSVCIINNIGSGLLYSYKNHTWARTCVLI
ncbi:hypothetical protein Paride_0235 [Pseudomonas phage Paride]|nr:hypothetical protein Deiofobo_0235 [Pseudomonas phage Deifobo]WPK39945.1 hypothetical protein ETTORE_0236 [Pseudomonas phage Ettore]WPK40465.1 hypothetical protein Paride_0235 [Pseudomonas phage Paride]